MPRNNNPVSDRIKTPIPFVMKWIAKEDTHRGTGRKFVGGGGGEIGVAFAAKNTKVCISGVDSM